MGSPARTFERHAATRAIVAAITLALMATLTALEAPSATATALGERIGSARRGQGYWESVMLQADRLVSRLDRGAGAVRRDLRRANRNLRQVKSRRAAAHRVVLSRAARVRHLERKLPPEGDPVPDWIKEKLRVAESQLNRARNARGRLGSMVSRVQRKRAAKQRRMNQYRRALRAAIGRQRAAEGALGGQIVAATRLAQQRAELKTYIRLGSPGSFVWPTGGSITQGYGCTGYAAYPPRGSCRHFHDGLDISPSGGTRIGSVATGVIAYAGWNPWDAEGRAFIVVVGHADGYVSRYGHLVPNRRVARAGQVVYRGQTIGYMGSTGNSTGVHLHLEILRGGSTIDPRSVFPAREDGGKVSKAKKKDRAGKKDKADSRPGKAKRERGGDARRKGGGKGKRQDRRQRDQRDQRGDAARGDAARGESTPPPIEAASGLTFDVGLASDVCVVPPRSDAPSVRDRDRDEDDPPTLSDLAEQLRSRAADCVSPSEEPQDDESWPGDVSPWDLSVLDEPEA